MNVRSLLGVWPPLHQLGQDCDANSSRKTLADYDLSNDWLAGRQSPDASRINSILTSSGFPQTRWNAFGIRAVREARTGSACSRWIEWNPMDSRDDSG